VNLIEGFLYNPHKQKRYYPIKSPAYLKQVRWTYSQTDVYPSNGMRGYMKIYFIIIGFMLNRICL